MCDSFMSVKYDWARGSEGSLGSLLCVTNVTTSTIVLYHVPWYYTDVVRTNGKDLLINTNHTKKKLRVIIHNYLKYYYTVYVL